METVVLLLMILIGLNCLLKETFARPRTLLAYSLGCALIIGLSMPFAIEQSRTQISDWLRNTDLMLDMAVILTVDVVLLMFFCLSVVRKETEVQINSHSKRSRSKRLTTQVLSLYPGLMIFPVFFSLLVLSIFVLPGTSFSLVAWSLAVVVLIVIPGGVFFLKWLIPEEDLRLELLFLSCAVEGLLGVIATVNGRSTYSATNNVDPLATLGVLGVLLAGTTLGFLIWRRRSRGKSALREK